MKIECKRFFYAMCIYNGIEHLQDNLDCVKTFRIRSYSGPNAGKCEPE